MYTLLCILVLDTKSYLSKKLLRWALNLLKAGREDKRHPIQISLHFRMNAQTIQIIIYKLRSPEMRI